MIFSDSPSQKALEQMMTQVKGFLPRGSGVMVLRRFEYTAEMCDCRLCLYYNRKKKCTVSQGFSAAGVAVAEKLQKHGRSAHIVIFGNAQANFLQLRSLGRRTLPWISQRLGWKA